jgi:UrcA family protein
MPISHRSIVSTVAVVALAGVTSLLRTEPAAAAVSAEDAPPSVTVRYHDLNLNSPEGVARLYGRIRVAAGEVCHSLESRELGREALWNDCYNHAVANAVKAVHNRTLSAYHWQRIRGWKHHEIETPTTVASQ